MKKLQLQNVLQYFLNVFGEISVVITGRHELYIETKISNFSHIDELGYKLLYADVERIEYDFNEKNIEIEINQEG